MGKKILHRIISKLKSAIILLFRMIAEFYFNTPPCFFNSYCKDFPNVVQKREKRASQLYDLWATLS